MADVGRKWHVCVSVDDADDGRDDLLQLLLGADEAVHDEVAHEAQHLARQDVAPAQRRHQILVVREEVRHPRAQLRELGVEVVRHLKSRRTSVEEDTSTRNVLQQNSVWLVRFVIVF